MIDPDALAMLTAEPTGGVVWHASRGAITLRVGVRGREAHVGQAHLGVNAFEHMIWVAEPLTGLAHDLLEQRTTFPVEGDDARGSILVVGGSAGSGANFNVVPDPPGSRRSPLQPGGTTRRGARPPDRLDRPRSHRCRRRRDCRRAPGAPSASTDDSHPTAKTLADCIERIEGRAPRFELCPGTLETRWYAQLGIPAFAYGGGRLDVAHGPDEFIDEAAMRRCAAVYALFAEQVLAKPPEA